MASKRQYKEAAAQLEVRIIYLADKPVKVPEFVSMAEIFEHM